MTNAQTTEDTHNGWTNYETWSAALIMDNEESSYLYTRQLVAEAFADEDDDFPRVTAADAIKDFMEQTQVDPVTENVDTPPLASQLLRAAFGQVNWMEIVDNIRSEEQ